MVPIVVFAVLLSVGCTIVALRRARAARIAQQRFEELFASSPVAMALSRVGDRKVVDVNDAYSRVFGVRRDEIVGRTPQDAGLVAADAARDEAFRQLDLHGSFETELELDTPRGKRAVMLWSRTVDVDGVAHLMTTFLDVTDTKHADDAVLASEQRLRELVENVNEVVWLSNPENDQFHYINPTYERVFERSAATLYADARDWMRSVHGEDLPRIREFAQTPTHARRETTFRIVRSDGSTRTVRVALSPVRDASGRVIRVAGVAEDITDQLQLEAQVRETQKLESVGLLAGGVAHDFNNILAVIAANASLLSDAVPDRGDSRELVDEIEAAVRRATSLTRQLLAFSRKQVIEPVVLDLNAAVTDTRKMLRRMLGEDISITTSLEPELGSALIDPGYLVQVIMNLCVNARDAMPRGGQVSITTRNVRTGDRREVMLALADSGCGMPAEVKARIFEPFFTTKPSGRGTGLGLSVVHGIVKQSGGRIEVESEVGVGTTMKIFFPFVDAPAERISDVSVAGASGVERILVVDDDMFVRVATSRALRARGYDVLEACDAQGALRVLRDQAVDLLVTDVVMPGPDGYELATAARADAPALKVLYMSGYTDDALVRHGVKGAEFSLLEKPFRSHVLLGKVRQLLDAN